ncbi:aspartate aminotransferase [Erwinia sp. OLTSP20]|uniref:MalY/PatB family protein n=1 Tax=unclassified Erwinia TaxID=2622719 RepID=UPI000C19D3F3|nr:MULTISPECIES: PatB family C-S lyase [unclassified Erwinia]PIJ50931.1 aspartate aminotransferase [Erwinia sp. OAMSP11]PIJ75942.1 aspartate aminotransferase [Erwinia sp. OLSSP12]PIJ83612.1 aspartate aminotransferase [Erwinia sp. OLCASP19]PIJ87468.1 aspartate aminotransferase [Erwinia sp. OLMTSP26]PIJ89016.1 aspartate aminotransferase [Erwinia sp. OLMDSP33]
MAFNFDQRIDRRHSDSLKWAKYGGRDVLPLWVADTDFRSPSCIIDALQQRVAHGIFGYGKTPSALIDTVVERMASRYQWQIEPDWVIILPGVVTALNLSVRAWTQPGESTIAPLPIYPPFRSAAALAGREQRYAPLRADADGRWVMDLAALTPQLQGNEKLLMLCNPQNPGGTVYRRDELQAQLAFARRHNLLVCSDEIHCDLLLDSGAQHIPFGSLSDDAAMRSITLISPSKTFNIAGLGASVAIIPDEALRQQFNKTRSGIVPSVDVLAIVAATAAWRYGQDWLDAQLDYLRANRDLLVNEVNQIPGLQMQSPAGTYLGWIDCRDLQVASPALFFEKQGLGFSPGRDFGDDNFVRCNFGCARDLLSEAIRRMKTAVASR